MRAMMVAGLLVLVLQPALRSADVMDWPSYGHDPGGQRFSPLTQITSANVSGLKVAWTFRTGDAYQPENSRATAFEATPLYINGTLYLKHAIRPRAGVGPAEGHADLGL